MLKVVGIAAGVLAAACVSFAAGIPANSVHGNYMEARTADVYTGPCFANGEAEQVGREAVFGWKIADGQWNGVDVSGLGVVGVIHTPHTLGLVTEPVNPATAVLIVDSRANAEQRLALEAFARYAGGAWLDHIVKVHYAPIDLTFQNDTIHSGVGKLTAGSLATIETRAFNMGDHVCGNEEVWYQPLTKLEHFMPAYAQEDAFSGTGLGETWDKRFERSGFLGTFRLTAETGTSAAAE